ncbi:MAG: hypothetical protein BroJett002_35810 [Candidatus Brocadia sinica]|nr:MAG: hypothetical protein BroJett002_35810 [Candidatus Brocadia sinica]
MARKAMKMQAMALAMHVATITDPKSIPQVESTAGWTKMIYDIVRKVVVPAKTSVRRLVWFSLSLKILSNIINFY